MDGMTDRALLEARRDLLLVLLRERNLLVAMYPRFLALSLAFRGSGGIDPPHRLRNLCITSERAEALAMLEQTPEPFHLLVSEHLADGLGLDLIAAVRKRWPEHRCVLLLTHNHTVLVRSALARGADAVVLEESLGHTGALVHAFEQVLQGRSFVDPACEALEGDPGVAPAAAMAGEEESGLAEPLTPREVEVLRLVAQGCSNREIGERLHIAASTARDHVQDILRRLGVKSRAAAAVAGVRLGYCR
jgi:DNA-binding NarL/FixJ family response regulator